jgi:hypothetical protein
MVELKAAARRIEITPDASDLKKIPLQGYSQSGHPWETTYGRLHARILVLEAGGVRAVIVGLDSCFSSETPFSAKRAYSDKTSPDVQSIEPALPEGARERWAAAAGCPSSHVFVTATHTHTAPVRLGGTRRDDRVGDVRNAIVDATASLEPATMSLGTRNGDYPPPAGGTPVTPGLARLRRPTLEPAGTAKNPNPPRYAIDDTLSVLRIGQNAPGVAPIALLVNYGAHPTLSIETRAMSPDFAGEAMAEVESLFDPAGTKKFASIFIQGCCGDVSPVWPDGRRDYGAVREVASYLFHHVLGTSAVAVPLTPDVLRAAVCRFKPSTRPNYGASVRPKPEPEVVVSGIRLAAEAVLLGASGELFSAYRRKLADWARGHRPEWDHVLVGSMVNGYSGYLPTAEDFRVPSPDRPNPRYILEESGHETYEMSVTPYTEGIETELESGIGTVLAELR